MRGAAPTSGRDRVRDRRRHRARHQIGVCEPFVIDVSDKESRHGNEPERQLEGVNAAHSVPRKVARQ
jgi:hypothetical protein